MQYYRIVRQVDAHVRRVYSERLEPSQRCTNDVVEHLLQCFGIFGHHVPNTSYPSHTQGRIVVDPDQRRDIPGRLSNSQTALENQS